MGNSIQNIFSSLTIIPSSVVFDSPSTPFLDTPSSSNSISLSRNSNASGFEDLTPIHNNTPSPVVFSPESPIRKRVLIVDDVELNRKMMNAVLIKAPFNYSCDLAKTWEEAHDYLYKQKYNVIFMDNQLDAPKTGLELLISFRNKEEPETEASKVNQLAKIFLWTSDSLDEHGQIDGVDLKTYAINYLHKPTKKQTLINVLSLA